MPGIKELTRRMIATDPRKRHAATELAGSLPLDRLSRISQG
jgi:hypothetical protein